MTVCLLCFVTAFILAGFVTKGKGINLDKCQFSPTSYAQDRKDADDIVSTGMYVTVGLAGALMLSVIIMAVAEDMHNKKA